MSRGVIYTATFQDFLNGVYEVDVPQGYNRVQINQFTAGSSRDMTWVKKGEDNVDFTGGVFMINQTYPMGRNVAKNPENSVLLKLFCTGIDTQSNLVAAALVGETVNLGMNGNPYKITNRTIRFYITNEVDALVNNLGVVLQYTFI